MNRTRRGTLRGAVAFAVIGVLALAFWQRGTLERLAIAGGVATVARVHVTFDRSSLTLDRAVLENVRVTSFRGEPIAEVARLELSYDLRDLVAGQRLFGLKSIEFDAPHLTLIHRPDGTYNFPLPGLQSKAARQAPLIARIAVHDGSADALDERAHALTDDRRIFVRNLEAAALLSPDAGSHFMLRLRYGERADRLYPVSARGELDPARGFLDARFTAPVLPVAAAVNFLAGSPTLAMRSGTLHSADARYFGIAGAGGALTPHLAATALLIGGSVAIAGLSNPIDGIAGRMDVYDNGLLTRGLTAHIAGTPVRVDGGIYGLRDPHLRLSVRGSGELAQLRASFAQATRLPISGRLNFGLLVEGTPQHPVAWIALASPRVVYASSPLDRLNGLLAFDGNELDVLRLGADYGRVSLKTRGRIATSRKRNAIELLAGAGAPPGAAPYAGELVPSVPLDAAVLATADDPKALAARGALWGAAGAQHLDALFDVDARGNGTIGPIVARAGNGSLYARVALDRTRGSSFGLLDARDFPFQPARAVLSGSLAGSESKESIETIGSIRITSAFGNAIARGGVTSTNGVLRGAIAGDLAGGGFGAKIGGTLHSPVVAGSIVVAGGHYRTFSVNGDAGWSFYDGTLHVHDTAVALGPLFLGLGGTVRNLVPNGTSAPSYDLAAQVHSSDAAALIAATHEQIAEPVQGSIDANLRVRGTGSAPSFSGTVDSPEGSVNGLSFRDLHGSVAGDAANLAVRNADVTVGSSTIALRADATAGSTDVGVDAPHLDLADLNDFFDSGDTFAGTGSLALAAELAGRRIVATKGNAEFTSARFRRIALGTVVAHWQSSGDAIATNLRFGGPTGEVALAGTIAPNEKRVNLRAGLRDVDLATWLPMLGYDVPVTGRLDAQTTLAGAYPDLAMQLHAELYNGTAGREQIDRFEVTASAANGHGTLESLALDLPSLHTTGAGSFGLRPDDRLAIVLHSTSENVGTLINRTTGKDLKLSGALDSVLAIGGTRDRPRLRDAVTITSLTRDNITIPRVAAEIDLDRNTAGIRNGEIDLARGRLLLAASVPIRVDGSRIAPTGGPLAASLTADDVELSNLAPLLPRRTQLAGRIDGSIAAGGTVRAPLVRGTLTLRDGAFSGPMERSPITGVDASLGFAGKSATLQSHAVAGGGTITARGTALLADLRRPADATVTLDAQAQGARLDLPDYFQGNLNGSLVLARKPATDATLTGDLTLYDARIPLATLLSRKGGATTAPALPNVRFQRLQIAAGPNVRVQSANVDVGGSGTLLLGGTLAAPTLDGTLHSTGGSLSFYRNFTLQRGEVRFDPSSGIVPEVDAVATTFVADPATAIRLRATGPATAMNLDLASDPTYDRQQILGILVGAQQFGAVRGVQSSGGGGFTTGSAVRGLAYGQLNTAFTRNMLEPLNTSLGKALGFSEVQITSDLQTGLGLNAVKAFGKNVNGIFAQSFGYPRTQSVGLEAHPSAGTGLRLTAYSSVGPTLFALQQQPQPIAFGVLNLNPSTALTPIAGQSGVTFLFERKFP